MTRLRYLKTFLTSWEHATMAVLTIGLGFASGNPLALVADWASAQAGPLVVWFHSEVIRPQWKYRLMYRPFLRRVLRRALPPVCKVDSASLVAIIIVAALKIWLLRLLVGFGFPDPFFMLRAVAVDLLRLVLKTYLISIILNAILSFVAPGNYSPAQSILTSLCDPVLNPIRRVIPSVAGLDLSPLWACIAIQALLLIIH